MFALRQCDHFVFGCAGKSSPRFSPLCIEGDPECKAALVYLLSLPLRFTVNVSLDWRPLHRPLLENMRLCHVVVYRVFVHARHIPTPRQSLCLKVHAKYRGKLLVVVRKSSFCFPRPLSTAEVNLTNCAVVESSFGVVICFLEETWSPEADCEERMRIFLPARPMRELRG